MRTSLTRSSWIRLVLRIRSIPAAGASGDAALLPPGGDENYDPPLLKLVTWRVPCGPHLGLRHLGKKYEMEGKYGIPL